MSDNDFTPPNPVVVAQWAGMGRHILTFGGAALAAFGISPPAWLANLTDPQMTIIITITMVAVGLGSSAFGTLKSWWNKPEVRRTEVASAVASAEIGVPVTVTVTPAGMPNIASKVSIAEQVAAPVVPRDVTPSPAPQAAA